MVALADPNRAAVKLEALQEAARARDIELSIERIASGEKIAAAIDRAHASGAKALNVLASPLLYANHKLIMDQANALSLPAIYQWPETAAEGGFAAYGPSLIEVFREPYGRQLVQLLRGVKPADIPIEQPTKFELVIATSTLLRRSDHRTTDNACPRRRGDRIETPEPIRAAQFLCDAQHCFFSTMW